MRRAMLAGAVALLLAAVLAGCLTGEDTASPDADEPASDEADEADEVRTLATSKGQVSYLGLAVYEGIDVETVEPYVPGDMTPVGCFEPDAPDTVDVTLLLGQRAYESVPGEDVGAVNLIGCAERPEGLAREDANEPPWVGLTGWLDGDAHARFLAALGLPDQRANISFEDQPQGFTVSAETDGTTLLEGSLASSPAGVPAFPETSCEPVPMDGRSIFEAENGSLVALDWNKSEAICPAQASLTWPDDSPVAEILGPAHAPDIVAHVDVEEARYWWRALPDP